jgi:ribose transport system substrate-binding protein
MINVWNPRRLPIALWLVSGLLTLAVSACGTSKSASSNAGSSAAASSPSSSATSSAGLTQAKANVDAHIQPPSSIGATIPIGKAIPKGKVIAYVDCGAPACTNQGNGLKEAASVLGWTVKVVQAQPTPAAVQAAMDQVIRIHPDAVVSAGLSKTQYPNQFGQLLSMHIPIVTSTGLEKTGEGGTTLNIQDVNDVIKATSLLADKTVVDMNASGEIGVVYLTGFPLPKFYTDGYVAEVHRVCLNCTVQTINIDPTSIGKDAPQKLADFLRANPNIQHVFFGYDALALGLPAAVAGSGISMPKTYSYSPDQSGVAALQTGERTAAVPQPYHEIGWQWADGLARIFTGRPVSETGHVPAWVLWSKGYNNLPTTTNDPVIIPAYQAQYKKLWGIA